MESLGRASNSIIFPSSFSMCKMIRAKVPSSTSLISTRSILVSILEDQSGKIVYERAPFALLIVILMAFPIAGST